VDQLYTKKPSTYFANAREDIVKRLTTNSSSSILELGCGSGATGRLALATGKAGRYVGIELSPTAAREAAKGLTEVLVGDVHSLDLTPLHDQFDALIASEVLEHLMDPWETLSRLAACVRPGGAVFASSPNVAHWRVIRQLLGGRFDYQAEGVFDRTHLRWFTPATFRAMFEDAGFAVDSVAPVAALGPKSAVLNRLSAGKLSHLMATQIMIVGHRPVEQHQK
jgi:2-polyprenyl-3-methyl-5-hydroxy-6-metoxy-1,4-benzoquinol methylase